MNITILFLILYVIGLFVLTYFSARREKDSDFVNASQKLGWFSFGMSNFAAMLSGYNIVVGIAIAALFGPWYLSWLVGYIGSYLFFYYLYTRRLNTGRETLLSIPDYYGAAFGRLSKWATHVFYAALLLFFLGVLIYINADILANFSPLSSKITTALVALIVLGYTFWGGFKTVVKTDIFQGLLMLVFVALLFTGDFSAISFDALRADFLAPPFIILGIALAVLQFLVTSADPTFWQRIYAVETARECRKGLVFSFALMVVVAVPIALIGFAARYAGVDMATTPPFALLSAAAPSWFIPILAVAVFAAFMSTIDSYLFAFASQIASAWRGERASDDGKFSKEMFIGRMRRIMLFAMVVGVTLAFFSTGFLQFVFNIASISAVMTAVLLSAWLLRTRDDREVFLGIIVGAVAFIGFWWAGLITADLTTALYPSAAVVVFMILQRGVMFLVSAYKNKI